MEFRIILMFVIIGGVLSETEPYIEPECNNLDEIERCVDFFEQSVEIRNMDDDLCPEVYPIMSCLHDYVQENFPDSNMREDYLCKMRNFQDRVKFLCKTEQNLREDSDSEKEDEETDRNECLGEPTKDAEECYREKTAELMKLLREKNYVVKSATELEKLKCTLFEPTLQCLKAKLEERCDAHTVASVLKSTKRKGALHLGEDCIKMTIEDFDFFNESE